MLDGNDCSEKQHGGTPRSGTGNLRDGEIYESAGDHTQRAFQNAGSFENGGEMAGDSRWERWF